MSESASIDRIAAQIVALNQQEEDALGLLTNQPLLTSELEGLIRRVRTDREHLLRILRHSVATGRSEVRWRELVAE